MRVGTDRPRTRPYPSPFPNDGRKATKGGIHGIASIRANGEGPVRAPTGLSLRAGAYPARTGGWSGSSAREDHPQGTPVSTIWKVDFALLVDSSRVTANPASFQATMPPSRL